MDKWIQRQQQQLQQYDDGGAIQLASSSQETYNPYTSTTEKEDYKNDMKGEEEEMPTESTPPHEMPPKMASPTTIKEGKSQKDNRNKMWPPWPFNLMQRSRSLSATTSGADVDITHRRRGPAVRMGGVVWSFFGQRARVSVKEMQDIGSRLWFHLPPMTPPFIFLCLMPRQGQQQAMISAETGLETLATKTVIPLFSNPLARFLVLGGFSLAIMSWAHSELNRVRKLTPLPLNEAYRDIHKAVLPHVLPDEVPEPFLLNDDDDDDDDDELPAVEHTAEETTESPPSSHNHHQSSISKKLASSVPPRLQRHFKMLGDHENANTKSKPKRSWGSTWLGMRSMRDARKAEAQKVRRMAIYDELVALQAIKGKAQQARKQRKPKSKSKEGDRITEEPLGYALVTGASKGIGRAIAGTYLKRSRCLAC